MHFIEEMNIPKSEGQISEKIETDSSDPKPKHLRKRLVLRENRAFRTSN